MRKVLVTGGAGYIGSHTCKALRRVGFEPIVYDNLSRGNQWAVKYGPLEVGHLDDSARLMAVLERYRPIAVMHFAALAYVGESINQPFLYYRNNVAGTIDLLQCLGSFGQLPVVFSSTCATYGVPTRLPVTEDHSQHPINPYGRSKLIVEHLLREAGQAHGLRSVSLRYFNAAGADPDGEIGEAHTPETHLIPLVLTAARKGTAVQIFGSDYETPDGTCIRDYVHVADIADAHVRALHYLTEGRPSCAVNLANEQGYSVLEVIAAAERVTAKAIKIEYAARRPGDPPVLVGSAARAAELLGWRPTRSDLTEQVRDAWQWMQSHPE
jgi:UDP-glucose-4-epimerase GalE